MEVKDKDSLMVAIGLYLFGECMKRENGHLTSQDLLAGFKQELHDFADEVTLDELAKYQDAMKGGGGGRQWPYFHKKPVMVEAVQIKEEVEIETLEGTMTGRVGDWLITGVAGEQYSCKPDIFDKTYYEVPKHVFDDYKERQGEVT